MGTNDKKRLKIVLFALKSQSHLHIFKYGIYGVLENCDREYDTSILNM